MSVTVRRAAILTVGDELLAGRTINTNAAWLGDELGRHGYNVVRAETIPDDEEEIARTICRLADAADLVVVTGGLGPTQDDLTREGLARAAGVALREDRGLLTQIAERTQHRAQERNARMALVPVGGAAFENPVGTAPGLRLTVAGTPVYALPGPPAELRAVFAGLDLGGAPRSRRILRVYGPHEAELAETLGELLARGGEPEMGVTARGSILTVSITGAGADERAAAVRARLGDHVFGEDEDTLPGVVVATLRERGQSVAVAESLTGGAIADAIVSVPGASDVFCGGVVAYTAKAKYDLLGVPQELLDEAGTVDPRVAQAMANGARARFDADIGVATTGVAGPDPHSGRKVGDGYIAIASAAGTRVIERTGAAPRPIVRRRFTLDALWVLCRGA